MDNSNYLMHIHTGDGGSSDNGTSGSTGGRGGDVLLHSNMNNVSNVWHIYGHSVGTPIGDAPPRSGLYICLRYRTLEFQVEFVPRLFLFIIRIHHQAQDRIIYS
ncbi:hypothetical protein BS47DRAFT_1354156 [Hydnum rufescens UP504]|uniref:Uncharacterized protein n=1 Tax=Hydnum rufescens UP504 TaxID=1448309 RepID=A0A9P6DNJ9_9AGAM|nr:hypothetical protein BS47DRAFT_1354156 [Hydnum rufescens UP504]